MKEPQIDVVAGRQTIPDAPPRLYRVRIPGRKPVWLPGFHHLKRFHGDSLPRPAQRHGTRERAADKTGDVPDANDRPPLGDSHRDRRAYRSAQGQARTQSRPSRPGAGRRRNRRAIAGGALLALWFAFLAALATGHNYCFDPATGRSGIDALDHCATHHPLGLPVVIGDHAVLWSFVLMPAALAVLWWPWRPWRRRHGPKRG
jgi:hypothetical protein